MKNQDFVEILRMVDREVLCNVNGIITKLAKCDCSFVDEHYKLFYASDQISAAIDFITDMSDTEVLDLFEDAVNKLSDDQIVADLLPDEKKADSCAREILTGKMDGETATSVCYAYCVEAYEIEVLEHWAVTSWMADALRKQGENVEDVEGVEVWARTTSGQSIALDGCIQRVWVAMKGGGKIMDSILYSKILAPVKGYSVLFEALPENVPVTDGVENGNAVWFIARVTVSNGEKTGTSYLGGCAYNSFSEFHVEYADDYLADMIAEAIEVAEL